jgi:hypothetical protein
VDPTIVTFSGATAWTQWVFWQTAYTRNSMMSNVPIDPVTALEYPYSVTADGQEYELAAILEDTEASLITSSAYAWIQEAQIYVRWNYNGKFLKVRTGTVTYLLWIPSIIASDFTSLDSQNILLDIITNERLVYNGYKNLPASFSWSVYDTNPTDWFDFWWAPYVASEMILFSWDTNVLETDQAQRVTLLDNLQASYSWTTISLEPDIIQLLAIETTSNEEASNYVALALNNSFKTTIPTVVVESTVSTYPWCDTSDIIVWPYTISSCNVWTTTASTDWTVSRWEYFQWWRNKGFAYWDTTQQATVIAWNIWLDASTDTDWFVWNSSLANPSSWANTDITNNWWDTTDTNIARQWPCASWYHVPSEPEWADVLTVWWWWIWHGQDWVGMQTALNLPYTGMRYWNNGDFYSWGTQGYYWLSAPTNGTSGEYFRFYSNGIQRGNNAHVHGYSVRCFKDTPPACAPQPWYSHTTFTTGTPTTVNQTWQKINNVNPCYYACTELYAWNDCSIAPPYFEVNQNPNCQSDFTLIEILLDWVQDYYVQSCTWLKWETTSSAGTYQWATNDAYTEPSWNWTSYDYASEWRVEADYPAFQYCTAKWTWWRLPTKKEILSIMSDTETNNNWSYYTKLESITTENYWSSTFYAFTALRAWNSHFSSNSLGYPFRTDSHQVLCIHD